MEQCNCEQALYYKKQARKLANAIKRYAQGDQEKYGTVIYLAKHVVSIANKILKGERNE